MNNDQQQFIELALKYNVLKFGQFTLTEAESFSFAVRDSCLVMESMQFGFQSCVVSEKKPSIV